MGILEFLLILLVLFVVLSHFGFAPAGIASGQVMNLIMLVVVVLVILWLVGSVRGGPIVPYRLW